MIDLTRSLDIPAPAAAVWQVLADYRRDHEWRKGVVSMEPDTPGLAQPGTRTHEVLRLGGKTSHIMGMVDEVDPGTRFTWHTTDGADANGFRLVEPVGGDRCRVTLGITIRPHGAEVLMVPVFRRMMAKNLVGDLNRLRHLVVPTLGAGRRSTAADPAHTPGAA